MKVEREISDSVLALIRTTGDFIHQGREVQVGAFHFLLLFSSVKCATCHESAERGHGVFIFVFSSD